MRFSFILSEDSSLLLQRVDEVAQEFYALHSASAKAARHVYWGNDGLSSDFWQKLTIQSLLPQADFFLIRNAEKLDSDTWKKLTETLGTLRDDAFVLIALENAWEKGKPKLSALISGQKCYTFAEKKNWLIKIAALNDNTKKAYIKKALQKRALNTSSEIFEKLAHILAPNASSIENTLDQLLLACQSDASNEIQEKYLEILAPASTELLLFDYLNHIESNNVFTLWEKLLLDGKADDVLFGFIALMSREARQLWQVLSSDKASIPPFLLHKKTAMAKKLGKAKILQIFLLCREAEWALKSGRKNETQAMEELLVALTLLYR